MANVNSIGFNLRNTNFNTFTIMKKIIVLLMLAFVSISYAEVVQHGTTFVVTETTDQPTIYTWQDKDGKIYTIYKTKSGSFYIKKISKKTGKEYKYYLPKEQQEKLKQLA